MKLNHLVAGIVLALGGTAVHAASFDLSYGPFSTEADKFSNAAFTDTYNFSFTGVSGMMSASLIELKLGSYVDIVWPSANAFTVYSAWDGQGTALQANGNPGPATGYFAVEDLAVPAQFSIVVRGQATGSGTSAFQPGLKGTYDLSVMAQPVPEASSGYLLLVGLAALAVPTLLRKRNARNPGAMTHADRHMA